MSFCIWQLVMKCPVKIPKMTFTFLLLRDYYGERIALYFAWLEFYTLMLVPVSIIGIAIFIYGVSLWNNDPISNDVCNKSLNIVM